MRPAVFDYVKEQHNVYRVTQDEFWTCEPANHTLGVWATGHDLVNLTMPLPLQRRRPLPRGHEILHRGGRATPTGPAVAATAAELGRRAVDCTAARVAGGGADPIPRGDWPTADSRLIIDW